MRVSRATRLRELMFLTSSFTKENLRDLLGNDIPQERINAIIKEADLTEDNRISYPEFLALWEENPATSTSGGKSLSIGTIDSDESYTDKSDSTHKMELRADSDAEPASLARENFVEGKMLSERKAEQITKIDVHEATLVILNTVNEIEYIPDIDDDKVEYPGPLVSAAFANVPPEITKSNASYAASELSRDSSDYIEIGQNTKGVMPLSADI